MKQTDFIKKVAEETSLSQKDVKRVLEASANIVADAMKAGDSIVTPFGKFSTRTKAARKGVNPFTKQEMEFPEKKVVAYKPSIHFRLHINS